VTDAVGVRPPHNPARRIAWAAAWIAVAVLGFVVLATDFGRIISGDVYGQRSEGVLLFTPIIGLLVGILLIISAVRGIEPWNRYVASTTSAERQAALDVRLRGEVYRGPLALAIVLAAIWAVFVVVLAVNIGRIAQSTPGLFAALMLLALVAMGWIALLGVALRRRAAHRRAPDTL